MEKRQFDDYFEKLSIFYEALLFLVFSLTSGPINNETLALRLGRVTLWISDSTDLMRAWKSLLPRKNRKWRRARNNIWTWPLTLRPNPEGDMSANREKIGLAAVLLLLCSFYFLETVQHFHLKFYIIYNILYFYKARNKKERKSSNSNLRTKLNQVEKSVFEKFFPRRWKT